MHASCICGKVAGGPEESSRSKEKRRAGFPGSVSGGGSGRPLLPEAGSLGWGWAGAGASMGYAAGFPFVSRPPRRRQVPASSMRHRTGGGNRMQGAGCRPSPPGLRLLCLTQHQGPLLGPPSGCGPLCLSGCSSESDWRADLNPCDGEDRSKASQPGRGQRWTACACGRPEAIMFRVWSLELPAVR